MNRSVFSLFGLLVFCLALVAGWTVVTLTEVTLLMP